MTIILKAYKDEATSKLVFDMLDILKAFGCTEGLTNRRLEKMAKACLALGDIKTNLSEAKSANDDFFLGTREIIAYENEHYGENISSGSYDDIRRQDLATPVELGLVINSSSLEKQATNNPNCGYALSPLFASLVRQYGKPSWEEPCKCFVRTAASKTRL